MNCTLIKIFHYIKLSYIIFIYFYNTDIMKCHYSSIIIASMQETIKITNDFLYPKAHL